MNSKKEIITIEYGGKLWRRYPKSKKRTHRVYYQRHEKWKEPPVFLHRKIYEDNFGKIPEGYHIHHIDGDTENNSPDNLEALSPSEHSKITMEELLKDDNRRRAAYSKRGSVEARRRNSEAQKNRCSIEAKCKLCGKVFMTKSHSGNIKWCPECKKMIYSDKNGQHFSRKKQLERFGKVLAGYDFWA